MKLSKQTSSLIIFFLFCFSFVNAQNDITKVRLALKSSYAFTSKLKISSSQAPMTTLLNRISSSGTFNRTDTVPRVPDLTDTIFKINYVFFHPDSTAYYQVPEVKFKIYRALNKWLSKYPGYQWSSSAFDQPQKLGIILVMMFDHMKVDSLDATYGPIIKNIKQKALNFIRHSWSNGLYSSTFNYPSLGTIKTDQGHRTGNVGYRILGYTAITAAIEDVVTMNTLNEIMANQFPLIINKRGEDQLAGNLFDGSLFQHGSQTFNVGYGSDWINDAGNYGRWVKGTKWQYSTDQIENYGKLLNDGMRWTAYKKRSYHNIMGRNNQQYGPVKYNITGALDHYLAIADPSNPLYSVLSKLRNDHNNQYYVQDSSKYLWNSHLIIQDVPKYAASIKMLSSRILGTETGDAATGQGRKNFHIADGSTLIYRRIDEFDNVRVAWDWRCIPGITAKQKTGTLPLVDWGKGYESNNTIAGGVSDGAVSIGAFKLDRRNAYDKTKALKSYFTFKDAIICLGNSITDTIPGGDVYTTINQTERKTDIHYQLNGTAEQTIALNSDITANLNVSSASWFWQDSIGYIVIPKTTLATSIVLKAKVTTGNWANLDERNKANYNTTVSVNVFQLSINHGVPGAGKDDSYRYLVLPSVSKADLINFYNQKVLSADSNSLYINYNNAEVISVSYDGYTAAFFTQKKNVKASKLGADSLSISADKPVALLIKRKPSGLHFNVSDLDNTFTTVNEINIGVNRALKSASFNPTHASGPSSINPDADSTLVKVNTGKSDFLYEGEPVQFSAEIDAQLPVVVSQNTMADAFVQNGTNAGTNYGLNSYLALTTGSTGYIREAFLKFDLRNMKGNVLNAKLALYSASQVTTQWDLYRVLNNNWTETSINWNNKPAAEPAIIASLSGASAAGYVYWDISTVLQNLGADSIITFKLAVPASTGYIYSSLSSLQSSNPPKIIYTLDNAGNPVAPTQFAITSAKQVQAIKADNTIASMQYKTLNITNALSPNGDGINDFWVVEDIQLYQNNNVRIVNRTGLTVYEKKNYDNTWDGSFNGKPLPEGTYYYAIDFGSGIGMRKGFISIVR